MADYGMWQGISSGLKDLNAAGMGVLRFNAEQQHQKALEADSAARLKMAQDQAKIQNAQQNIALEEAQKKQAADNRLVDLTTHPAYLSLPEAQRPEVLKFFADNGLADPTGKGTAGRLREGVQMIESSTPLFQKFMGPVVQAKQQEVISAWGEFQEAQATGDPKKTAVARQKFDQLNGAYHQSLGKFDEHIKNLTDQEQKMALERAKGGVTDEIKEYNLSMSQLPPEKRVTFPEWKRSLSIKEGVNQTEEQLTARALKGDKEAQAILDAMQARKKDLQSTGAGIADKREEGRQARADRQYEITLRKEFNNLPEVKEYNQTVPKIKSMQSAYEASKKTKNFVAVDQALVTLFNKLTDPQSVVRESEYARTAQNIPLLNQIKGKIEKVMKGGAGLTAEERKSLMDMANLMQQGYEDIRNRRLNEYKGYGAATGLRDDFLIDSSGTQGKKVGRFIVEVE